MVQCIPGKRPWSRERCVRCTSKNVECSARQRATATSVASDAAIEEDTNALQLYNSIGSDHDQEAYLESIGGSRLVTDA